jgi:hypothetical protein
MRTYSVNSISGYILGSLLFIAACGPSVHSDSDAGGDDDGGACTEGTHRCEGLTRQTCTGGVWQNTEDCPQACDNNLGCTVCVPGTGTCNGDTAHECRPDGQGYVDEYCDPLMGSSCGPDGVCIGPCSAGTLGQSYIGCDYFATQTSQLVDPSFQFAVAISNTSAATANVTIDGGMYTTPQTITVATGQVAVQYLPWVPALKRCMTEGFYECGPPESYGGLALNGAYHVRSDEPVTVYQFSPLDYAGPGGTNSGFSYSNDASLLLPTNAWTGNYVVPTWPMWNPGFTNPMPSVLAVTAYQDDTNVTITTRANTTGGDGAPSFTANASQTVTINAGDVLQLMSDSGDLTGSVVAADKGVQVVAGQHCTQVPIGYTACDHIEETAFPTEALSNDYLVTAPYLAGTINGPRGEVVRITAAQAGAVVNFDPASVSPQATLSNVGDFIEIPMGTTDFHVQSTGKVVVSQYMASQDAPPAGGAGDPAMTLAVPVEQYRLNYQFHAPTNYADGNYVNITANAGQDVTLDGAIVPQSSYAAIGNSGYSVARVLLSNAGNGTHTAVSSQPFGVSVYGYGQYTSYWYPGGLDLTVIPVE